MFILSKFAGKLFKTGLIILIFISLSLISPEAGLSAEEGAFPGDLAPDFNLQVLNQEEEFALHQTEEEYILLNFWTTWCPACQEEMPELQQLHEEHGDEITVLAVNVGQSASEVREYIEEAGFNFTVLLDENQDVANQYLVRGVPTTFVINEENIIQERHVGPMDYNQKLELLNITE